MNEINKYETEYLSSIEEVLEDAKKGKMFILVDDEDRENEGDLCVLAEFANAEAINFMAKNGRGLICLALERQRVETLGLEMMQQRNISRLGTAFTVSIEASEGVTTGISAADRAKTIQVAINKNTTPHELSTPGHVFPLVARDGGTLMASARPLVITNQDKQYPSNFSVLSATVPNQISFSNPALKHGIFSFYLMKGLEGYADGDNDGKIIVSELDKYLRVSVGNSALTMNKRQTPYVVGDFEKVIVER